jgi:hypothetical protein
MSKNNQPKSKTLKLHMSDTIDLIINGQGVFLFNANNMNDCHFTIYNIDKTDGIKINMTSTQVLVSRIGILAPYTDVNNNSGLSQLKGAYYWFSIDSQNQMLHLGIGEARIETVIYKYKFMFDFERDDLRIDNKLFLESLTNIHINDTIKPMVLLRDPITCNIPLLVRDNISMIDIATSRYMPKANLSLTAQKLYDCIAGSNFILDTDDFPYFSKAIEQSIINPDGWCYKTLQKKAGEFNKEKPKVFLSNETYLRITLGHNNGESPGIPYVMEIWPIGHYSPIHNHAGAEAIIRVLHGSINVSLYPFLCNEDIKFAEANFTKDDITWISPTLNQTHKLRNINNDTVCITIQCYTYNSIDNNHYDYFDYLDSNNNIMQYEPNSDMDFVDFKNLMIKEWESNNKRFFCCL